MSTQKLIGSQGGYSNIPRYCGCVCAAEHPMFRTKPSLKQPLVFTFTRKSPRLNIHCVNLRTTWRRVAFGWICMNSLFRYIVEDIECVCAWYLGAPQSHQTKKAYIGMTRHQVSASHVKRRWSKPFVRHTHVKKLEECPLGIGLGPK